MAIITDTKARNVKPNSPQIPHGGVVGLNLIPSLIKGRGKWVLRYVSPVSGKRRNAGLGTYPEISIADVGKAGAAMREMLATGKDPLEERKLESSQPSVPCFKDAAETLHQELSPSWKNRKHAQQWINTLSDYVFSVIGDLPLDRIQPKHIADALRPIWLEKPETASRLKQRIHAVMAWGWAHGHCAANPVDVVHHLLPPLPAKAIRTEHQPAVPWKDIPQFFKQHLHSRDNGDITPMLLEFLILTATRSGEVRGMHWSEVDLDKAIWTIPAERMKAKLAHRVPLTRRSIAILKTLRGRHDELVFPSPRSQVVLSDMVLTAFLRRYAVPSDTAGRIATAHGFRSSFRDWCSENNYPQDLAERALAHTVKNKVEAAYHRTDLLDQRRPMMQAWENYCRSDMPNETASGLGMLMSKITLNDGRKIPVEVHSRRIK